MKLIASFALATLLAHASLIGSSKPNILWIITDDQRPDSVSVYNRAVYGTDESPLGYVESPNIDKLAEEGVLFTSAYCNSPACGPSRGSMHSGRYPFRNGHYAFETTHQAADFVTPTTHQTMQTQGYQTAIMGKTGAYIYNYPGYTFDAEGIYGLRLHFKHDLQKNGIGDLYTSVQWGADSKGVHRNLGITENVLYQDGTKRTYFLKRKGDPLTNADRAGKEQSNQEFELLRSYTRGNPDLILGGVNPKPAGETVDAGIVREFKNYLSHANKRYETSWGKAMTGPNTNKPLYINLGFHLPHTPVLPPKSYRDRFAQKAYKVPEFDAAELAKLPPQLAHLYETMKILGTSPEDESAGRAYNAEEVQTAIQDYYAFCAYGDELIGEAVDAFKTYCKENDQDYLIIYTIGDHGWHLGEQGIEAKFGPWRESVKNAALVVSSDKSKFPPGTVYDGLVEFVDFAPTILAAGGTNIEHERFDYLDGFDLEQVFHGGAVDRDYIVGEMNLVIGPRAYLRSKDFAFSMRTRPNNAFPTKDNLNKDIKWALECPPEKAEMALYDLRNDPLERNNVAATAEYAELAEWFRQKLGNIVLGDGRVECDWMERNAYSVSNFAEGAHDHKLVIPGEIIPQI
ncbi:MAG: sulfatase-like hydrolase/transferase [Verrucomicrobiota bacterium]